MARIVVLPYFELIAPRIQSEVRALLEAGHDVKVYNWDRGGPYRELAEELDVEVERIRLRAPEKGLKTLPFLPFYYIKLARRLERENFDVLHCTHFFMLPLCLLFRRKARIVYDAREMYSIDFQEYFPRPLSGLIRKTSEFLENKMIRKIDCILTVDSANDFLADRYRKFNDKVVVLYNVPELSGMPNGERVRELKRRYNDKKILVYIGGLTKSKGLMKELEAAKIIGERMNIKLLLIGRLKDSRKEALEYIEQNDLRDIVEFINWLPFNEMFSYLKVADVALALHQPTGIYKFVSKGNGRKFFTYMQASLPIVAPEFGEVGQVVREEKCGVLVDTTNPEAIAEGITHLLENPDEARAMGERGGKAVEEKYNWEIEKRKLLQAYELLESGVDE